MPRPKRAKVASTAARVVKPSEPAKHSEPAKPSKRAEQPAKPSVPQNQPNLRKTTISTLADSFSDDSDGLVVKSTRARRHIPEPASQEDADYTMTGAIPVASKGDGAQIAKKVQTPVSKARVSKDSARRSSSRISSKVMIPTELGSAQKDTTHVASEEGDSSGFGDHLLSFTSLGSESPAHGTRPPSAIKVGATPAHERSVLALTNFKRRARQPSLLRMVHQTTDVEDNDFDDLYDLEDFRPNAESTPLPKQQGAPGKQVSDGSGVNLSSSSSRGTKRKLSPVIQVPRSSPPYSPPSGPDVGVSRSPSPSLPDVVRSTVEEENTEENQEPAQPEIFSDTMAPPMSSSDYQVDEIEAPQDSPIVRRRGRARAAPAKADAEGSEGETMARARQPERKQASKSNKGISTAKLQALLPKRRTRRIHSDSESTSPFDSDEDELSMPPRRHAQLARKIVPPKTKAPNDLHKSARAPKRSTVGAKTSKNSRRYGRRISSDKENEGRAEADEESDESGDATQVENEKTSAHLEAMAKKFEEIDAFDLDFESVSYVQSSSSPPR